MSRVNATWLAATLGVAVLLAGAVLPSYAQTAAATHGRGHRLERLQTELGLTDDQVAALRQFRDSQRDQRRQIFRSLHDANRSLRELVLTGAPDDQIQAKTAEIQTYTSQSLALRVQAMRNLAQVLTPDQKEKLKTLHH